MTTYTKAHDEGACHHLCEDCTKEVFTVAYLEGARAFHMLDTEFNYSDSEIPVAAFQFLKDLCELRVLDRPADLWGIIGKLSAERDALRETVVQRSRRADKAEAERDALRETVGRFQEVVEQAQTTPTPAGRWKR